MAIINTRGISEQITELLNQNTVDSQQIVDIINSVLPPDQRLGRGVGVTQGVFKRFGEFDRVDAKVQRVTAGLWSGDESEINTFFTSSEQSEMSKHYYYNVYSENPQVEQNAEVEFAVAYGNRFGSGSATLVENDESTLASRAVYSQYRSLLLGRDSSIFEFTAADGTAQESDDIYAINVSRSRYREKMDAQNWELHIGGLTFIDDSGKKFDDQEGRVGNVFNVVSGSLNIGTNQPATIVEDSNAYGLFYPHQGIILLNPSALVNAGIAGVDPVSSSNDEYENHQLLLAELEEFIARRVEFISTQHFFVRATNREFNFSNNPTFATEDGRILVPGFTENPKTYITTVGLYNDSNEMIAVAKSSQPIPKSFDREVLVRVRLDF